ncbi:MAG: aspartate carbamoyltransferase, partial [SAR324 cluster bacterium]|nr:aspartate carbamoyltransferase [SAR324 cluster bacterium]
MSLLTIDEYLRQPVAERLPYYQREGRLYHVMMSQQFPRPLMEEIFGVANTLKAMSHDHEGLEFLSRLLRHKRAMLYFTQPSTRTFLSFLTACQLVGITTGEVQDPALSSEYKGESQEDAIRVFSSYFDLVIMRDPKPGFCEYIAY